MPSVRKNTKATSEGVSNAPSFVELVSKNNLCFSEKRLFNKLMKVEGFEFTDAEHDNGGKTKFGITEKTLRKYTDKRVDKLTIADAEYVVKQEFFIPLRIVDVSKVSERISYELLEFAYHSGISRSVKALQNGINAFTIDNEEIKVDGVIGNITIGALQTLKEKRAEIFRKGTLLSYFNVEQGYFYNEIIRANPTQKKWLRGWYLKRIQQ